MDIAVVGTGYVGLVLASCLADTGNDVICVDNDKDKLHKLNNNKVPIHEPGLEDIVDRNRDEGRLTFTDDISQAVKKSDIIYIAVGTPSNDDGSADLSNFLQAAREIGEAMEDDYKIIINKSTVPVGTADKVKEIIGERTDAEFDVVSNPEFLKEGNAVNDFMKPDRIILGTENREVADLLKELYAPFVRTGNPILVMGVRSAEMAKYTSNAMLASRISFMNEIANLCGEVGADVEEVRIGMGKDPRIGPKFLFPGAGYGGSCFPKDVKALINMGKEKGIEMELCRSVDSVNKRQKKMLYNLMKEHYGNLKDKKIAIWGLAFKPKTDDMRNASSIVVINKLLDEGADIVAYDPAAIESAREIFGDKIKYAEHPYDCLHGADGLTVITEWNEFRFPNFKRMGDLMKEKVIFDGRNILSKKHLKSAGFKYYGIGRN